MAVCKECQEKCEKCGNPIVPTPPLVGEPIRYVYPDFTTTTDNPNIVFSTGTNNLSFGLVEEDCPSCEGTGKVSVYKTIFNRLRSATMDTADGKTSFVSFTGK